jgi:AcrR family transcriptional regulator
MTPPHSRDYGGRSADQRREDRRERLVSAGLELFGTKGYVSTSIERLCTRASVSTRNFYEEFAGREALLIALYDQITERVYASIVKASADTRGEPLEQSVATVIKAYVGTLAADPRWTRVVYVEAVGVSPEMERHRLAWRARLCALIEDMARTSTPGQIDPNHYRLTALAFVGASNELIYHWTTKGIQNSLDSICDELHRLSIALLTDR